MPASRRKVIAGIERSSSESSIYTASGASYGPTDSEASSSSPAPSPALPLKPRRTRKNISTTQLAALEDLFAQSSHPSQQDRALLAKAVNMEVKNVTIWFQNRRQAARKLALHEAIVYSNSQRTSAETARSLVDSLDHASPVTPEQVATPPPNEAQLGTLSSSCPSPAVADSAWPVNGSRYLTKKDAIPSTVTDKNDLDHDMIAAAMALAQMRTVDVSGT